MLDKGTDPLTDIAEFEDVSRAKMLQSGYYLRLYFDVHSRFCDAFVTWNIIGINGSFQIQQNLCESRQSTSEKFHIVEHG